MFVKIPRTLLPTAFCELPDAFEQTSTQSKSSAQPNWRCRTVSHRATRVAGFSGQVRSRVADSVEGLQTIGRYDMRVVFLFLVAEFLIVVSGCGVASAQTACPQGVAAGSAQCGPSPMIESVSSNAPPTPQVRWGDSWGGMASDVENGISGIVTDLASKRQAKRAAIQECKARGGVKCTIAMTYKNQCLVVVDGAGSYFVSSSTIERAARLALEDCTQGGGLSCHVYYSGCSLAKRVW